MATAINENSGAGQVIYTATSTDSGDTSTGSTSYSLGGADAALFSINASTGAVTLLANPNYEAKASYSFSVIATDAAGNASTQGVTLAINNLDEVAPAITSGGVATAINENSGAGQVIYTATSTDSGDTSTGSTSYSLGGADAALFSINASTGAVTLLANPNYEAKASYSFSVIATDAAGNASTQGVTLAINNLDEVAPAITSGGVATAINENSGAGQVIYTATSTDSGDTSTGSTSYSLGGADAALFSINASTGAVTLLANPNYEAKTSYSFSVIATDAAGNASTQGVTLAINNLDEVAPAITSGGVATAINENSGTGQVIYTATSTDSGDTSTGSTSYSLGGADAALFSINASTGAVTLLANPNYEAKASYSFSVIATDAVGNASTQGVTLAITNLNEAPTVDSPLSDQSASEDSAFSYTVPVNSFADVDVGDTLTYSARLAGGGALPAWLSFDANTRTFSGTPGNSEVGSLSLEVIADDGQGGTVTDTFVLAVVNTNDVPTVANAVTLTAHPEDSGARLITQAELLANASDVDGDTLTASGLSISAGLGTLVNNGDGTWTYTPAANDNSQVSFSYQITDGTATIAASASLDLTPVNDAPTASPATLAAINEDSGARLITQAELLANASDLDGDGLRADNLTLSSGAGSLINNGDGSWTYIPSSNDDTAVTFSYSISDSHGGSAAGAATLDLLPVRDAPINSPVTLTAIRQDSGAIIITQEQLLANAIDVDGNGLAAIGLRIDSGSGTLVDNGDGTWTYTPAVGEHSVVTFSYMISSGGISVAAWASLDHIPVNGGPGIGVFNPLLLDDIKNQETPDIKKQRNNQVEDKYHNQEKPGKEDTVIDKVNKIIDLKAYINESLAKLEDSAFRYSSLEQPTSSDQFVSKIKRIKPPLPIKLMNNKVHFNENSADNLDNLLDSRLNKIRQQFDPAGSMHKPYQVEVEIMLGTTVAFHGGFCKLDFTRHRAFNKLTVDSAAIQPLRSRACT